MPKPITLPEAMEREVRFVEDTPPGQIIEATLERLRSGASDKALYAAATLAVCRSNEIQIDHHGGPLHPVAGMHALIDLGRRLDGDGKRFAVVQGVALANRHVHSPEMGPAVMLDVEDPNDTDAKAAAGLVAAIHGQYPVAAERHLVTLLKTRSPGQVLDLMLDVALRRNALDDHYLLYPLLTARTLDVVGWEWARVLLRPVARWLAMSPISVVHGDDGSDFFKDCLGRYWTFDRLEKLVEKHKLLGRELRVKTGKDEDKAVADLGAQIGVLSDFDQIPELLAAAIAGGMSLEGAGEALSIGGATIHLRTNYGNPLDVHIHNGVAVRRYLIGVEGVSLRNKLLALLSLSTGPEIRLSMGKLVHTPNADQAERAGLPDDGPGLLKEIERQVESQRADRESARTGGGRAGMVAQPQMRKVVAAAEKYLAGGNDPQGLIRTLGRLVIRDDATELHSLAGYHDAVEQYETTRAPHNTIHLVSAAKAVTCGYGFGQDTYQAAKRHLTV